MIVRSSQFEAFQSSATDVFVAEMLEHLSTFAPAHTEALGPEATGGVVRLGINRAEKHDITTQGPVRLYIEIMFLLGSDFDTDPQYPRAAEILALGDEQAIRARLLYDWICSYEEKVFGPEGQTLREALNRVVSVTPESLDRSSSQGDAATTILHMMKWCHPEKCSFVGDARLAALGELARRSADTVMPGSTKGRIVVSGLMFLLGHGILSDPQYPWLHAAAGGEPAERAGDLHARGRAYARAALAK